MTPVPLSPSPTSVTSEGTMKQGVNESEDKIIDDRDKDIPNGIDSNTWFGLLSSPRIINAVIFTAMTIILSADAETSEKKSEKKISQKGPVQPEKLQKQEEEEKLLQKVIQRAKELRDEGLKLP
ncbi:hypothetical protein FNV43_RR14097 [Rhamnella rubrinervis]|uniref:Uncharacterized protein n=1 Tax=Rhamnella rubrinervis TaxID=2594499 RepID=A0A8K0H2K7_9ROSA|nr:hypothetical protein FNV43_RR14097 [Rhamnella rubrinervis]